MNYLLDTNVCIRFLTGRSQSIKDKIEKTDISALFICSVVRGELEYGARKSNNPERTFSVLREFLSNFPEVDFNTRAAEYFGLVRSELEKKGQTIGPYDMQIAAIALANDFILVTHNMKEFERIRNLKIEDWETV